MSKNIECSTICACGGKANTAEHSDYLLLFLVRSLSVVLIFFLFVLHSSICIRFFCSIFVLLLLFISTCLLSIICIYITHYFLVFLDKLWLLLQTRGACSFSLFVHFLSFSCFIFFCIHPFPPCAYVYFVHYIFCCYSFWHVFYISSNFTSHASFIGLFDQM